MPVKQWKRKMLILSYVFLKEAMDFKLPSWSFSLVLCFCLSYGGFSNKTLDKNNV